MGFDRHFAEGRVLDLSEETVAPSGGILQILVDRLVLKPGARQRAVDSAEMGFRFGGGRIDVWVDGRRAWHGAAPSDELGKVKMGRALTVSAQRQ